MSEIRTIFAATESKDVPEWQARATSRATHLMREHRFEAIATHKAMTDIRAHAKKGGNDEIIGLLLGIICKDSQGFYVLIEHAVFADTARSSNAQVTLSADDWTKVLQTIDEKHANATIVGWYHSHPGHGVFLSEPDLFIHRNFFDLPWQVAVVIDPISGACDAFTTHAEAGSMKQSQLSQAKLKVERPTGMESGEAKTSRMLHDRPMFLAMIWFIAGGLGAFSILKLMEVISKR